LENTRELGGQDEKKGRLDFALWIKARPEHLMQWPSPWGMGFPGWHIECSAMSKKYLGKEFDIHGGGMDLAATHHTNEIAQSQACNHVNPAHIWIHTNMLTVNGTRMSKSAGNGFLPEQLFKGDHPLLEKAYSPMTVRFFMMQTHYRSTLDFSNEALQAAEKGFKRLWEAYETLQKISFASEVAAADMELEASCLKTMAEMDDFMNDDFNTAKVLANLFELVPVINSVKDGLIKATALGSRAGIQLQTYFKNYLENILGLKSELQHDDGKLNGVLQLLIDMRREAKAKKDYATSDTIRNQLSRLGILLKDEKDGRVSISFD
jgi:cysteinyl-tRNA synthetase